MRTHRSRRIGLLGFRGALVALASACSALVAAPAEAQLAGTTNKPLPNVLLLVDTSGSMERMSDGSLPSQNFGGATNACSPGNASNPNRWGMLLQAMTGNFQPFYSCEAMDRSSTIAQPLFAREFSINGSKPYDADYFLPYHRPLTGRVLPSDTLCAVTPWQMPGVATGSGVGPQRYGAGGAPQDFPDKALAAVGYTFLKTQMTASAGIGSPTIATGKTCPFDQTPDGQLDAARDYVRFALMTFDNDVNERTGVVSGSVDLGAPPTGETVDRPFLGQWSYLRNSGNPYYNGTSNTPGVGARGRPVGCATIPFFEVGARNEFAPPWEGRLVPFPTPDASLVDLQTTNERIQKVLLASRPYGATPIDGMMDDARDYFHNKTGGPKDDPYQCREKFIILLTDGAPNLDLRPSCAATGAGDVCPYPEKSWADRSRPRDARPISGASRRSLSDSP